ncbi:hypothetical protein Pmani_012420 [Petrolisthes manimaculis]|uniref:Uncharacterized protein n=1 Tax=Petrolisthes manimaculis TaxID=1843537 RepID=A0AAE1PXW0_9EUCA|nr:hypothetical protein Pmani_012420 [Petrolisthes manimaculis]
MKADECRREKQVERKGKGKEEKVRMGRSKYRIEGTPAKGRIVKEGQMMRTEGGKGEGRRDVRERRNEKGHR